MDDKTFNLLKNSFVGIVAILIVLLFVVGFIAIFIANNDTTGASSTPGQSAQTTMNIYKIEGNKQGSASQAQPQPVLNYQQPQLIQIQDESTRLNVNTRVNVHVSGGYTSYPRYYPRYTRYHYYPIPYYPVRYASPNFLVHWGSYQY